jgi:hypothetical protein
MPSSSGLFFVSKTKDLQQKKRTGESKRWKLIRRLFSHHSFAAQISTVCVCNPGNPDNFIKKISLNTTQSKAIPLPSRYANMTFVLTSGKKVPFTREMHKKKKLEIITKMECISE